MLGRHVPEDFSEILLLSGNGYGIGAFKLLRGLYERVVTMTYLLQHPEKAEDFADWHLIEKQKLVNHLLGGRRRPGQVFHERRTDRDSRRGGADQGTGPEGAAFVD
ncbi:MAG TPA: DUF5677 domain-containing protein [Methylomirabilota bacterium]|nr:DUF5677 domain-containing protein [Methylomirabilota bacterium]